ncbi:DMT family transporter [Paludibacterium paludis]|uniref:Membrane protein n=1 Tax=Paludibacterium paludis TaxID=1225769 RepID=A0A918P5K2_9NEIS|nr:DMT family transporter [Paludibacterium paludis]GGY26413.1 membrane protein [Paludibacterium paludis]
MSGSSPSWMSGARSGQSGSAWMVLAALAFALLSVFVKLGSRHFDPVELLFYRTLIGALGLALIMAWRRETPATPNWSGHLRRTLLGYLSMACLFFAVSRLPLATAVTLNYTSSLFFALTCMIVFREIPSRNVLVSLVVGFAGIVWLLRPTFSAQLWQAGLAGLMSGALAGVAVFQVRELGRMGESAERIVIWFFSLSTAIGAVLVLATGGFHPVAMSDLPVLFGIGASGLIGQLAMTQAYKVGRKYRVASLAYLCVAFSAVLGAWIWGDALTLSGLFAIGLIVAAGLLSGRRS